MATPPSCSAIGRRCAAPLPNTVASSAAPRAIYSSWPSPTRRPRSRWQGEGTRNLAGVDWPNGATVRVRIGLHTGEGRVVNGDYIGMDVHRAARIAAAGHGGQVLISESTRILAERGLP